MMEQTGSSPRRLPAHLLSSVAVTTALLGPPLVACRPSPSIESEASYAGESSAVPASAAATSANAGGASLSTAAAPGSADAPSALLADVAPVSALAFDGRFLWVGSARGLRRVDVGTPTSADWLGREAGLDAPDVTALATDGDHTLWLASSSGVGVVESGAGGGAASLPHYRQLGLARGITHILPISSTADRHDAWLGTDAGLLHFAAGISTPIPVTSDDVVTSLDADVDGRTLWVGLRRRGLLRLDPAGAVGQHASQMAKATTPTVAAPAATPTVLTALGPEAADHLDFVSPVGITRLPNGTALAVGHSRSGGTRLLLLGAGGAVLMAPQSRELPVQAVIAGCPPGLASDQGVVAASAGSAPSPCASLGNLIAGPDAAPIRFRLELATRGEAVAPGSVRFVPTHRTLEGPRVVARPIGRVRLEAVTVVTSGAPEDAALFVGTRNAGTARITATGATTILPSGEVGHEAAHLSLACATPQRCFIATGTARGWELGEPDRRLESLPVTTLGGRLMALARAPDGSMLSIAGDPGQLLRIGRLSSDGGRFEPVAQVAAPVAGAVIATTAAVSPRGDLWVAIRERRAHPPSPSASPRAQGVAFDFGVDEVPRGVLEIQFPSLRVVHHRAYAPKEKAPPDVIPVDGDVRALAFQARTADTPQSMWFCTAHGIFRFREGTLDRWGEDTGLPSERCDDLLVRKDGAVCAATSAGPSQFDGRDWRPLPRWPTGPDGVGLAARGLAEVGARLWIGTPGGLWSMASATNANPAVAAAPASPAVDPRATAWQRDGRLLDPEVVSLTSDQFGRLWALGRSGVTRLEP